MFNDLFKQTIRFDVVNVSILSSRATCLNGLNKYLFLGVDKLKQQI